MQVVHLCDYGIGNTFNVKGLLKNLGQKSMFAKLAVKYKMQKF